MQPFNFDVNNETFKGALFLPETDKPVGGVLVFHDWTGCNEMATSYAEMVAELGYVAAAVDVYGNGQLGTSVEEKSALMSKRVNNRAALAEISQTALNTLKQLPEVDASKTAAIGFCFGGLCVLDLARSGAEVNAVISFHGSLKAADELPAKDVKAAILIQHGDADKMVPFKDVSAVRDELNTINADWQINIFSGAQHAFMNPDANDPDFGTVYNENVALKAWDALQLFLWDHLGEEDHECGSHCNH